MLVMILALIFIIILFYIYFILLSQYIEWSSAFL